MTQPIYWEDKKGKLNSIKIKLIGNNKLLWNQLIKKLNDFTIQSIIVSE